MKSQTHSAANFRESICMFHLNLRENLACVQKSMHISPMTARIALEANDARQKRRISRQQQQEIMMG